MVDGRMCARIYVCTGGDKHMDGYVDGWGR